MNVPHIWFQGVSGEWSPRLLTDPVVTLDAPSFGGAIAPHATLPAALLLRSRTPAGEEWLLLNVSLRPLSVNGERLHTGIRVINDKDEIRGADIGRLFFATDVLPHIEAFAGGPRTVPCPRCRLPIAAGQPIIRCRCGTAFHQDAGEALLCFSYAPHCPVCNRPTALTDTYSWSPAEL